MLQQNYEKKVRRAHLAREIIEVLLLVGIIIFVIQLGIKSYGYGGPNMNPTLDKGQLLIVSKLAYAFGSPQRGDVVVYNNPLNTKIQRIQRIIGIPGDTVIWTSSQISVNAHVLKEPYIQVDANKPENEDINSMTLAKNQYFVANDYRSFCILPGNDDPVPAGGCSNDSRNFGAMGIDPSKSPGKSLDRQYIIGKVVFVYWPFNKMHGVDNSPSTFAGIADRVPTPSPLLADITVLFVAVPFVARWRRRG